MAVVRVVLSAFELGFDDCAWLAALRHEADCASATLVAADPDIANLGVFRPVDCASTAASVLLMGHGRSNHCS